MKIYNTLTRTREEFVPMEPGVARIYACGPTVYNHIHIGNARPLCVFDTLRRYLEYRGMRVVFAQNFTDVDDKIIRKANEEGVTSGEIAERYIAEYRVDAEGLGVRDATFQPKATEHIGDIIRMVETLIQNGFAYETGGDVYFRAKRYLEYGKLSRMPIEDLEAGARIQVDDVKENPVDFALWKAAKPGEPFWESPWGDGRPGWHMECSAMVNAIFGGTVDIHCGGQDLIFPHHENESAQSECANGKPLACYWMHNGYINIDNRKMSKSEGNFFTVREVAARVGYEPIRLMMMSAHYRSPINFSEQVMEQNVTALERLYTGLHNLDFAIQNAPDEAIGDETRHLAQMDAAREAFIMAMEDDLNTGAALAAVFDLTKLANTLANAAEPVSRALLTKLKALYLELGGVLGLLQNAEVETLDDKVEAMILERGAARAAKDFATADRIRNELTAMGIVLEDTQQGVKWHRA